LCYNGAAGALGGNGQFCGRSERMIQAIRRGDQVIKQKKPMKMIDSCT